MIEVTQPRYHRWREQYRGMQAEETRRLTQLEKESAWLKKLLAEAELKRQCSKTLQRETSEPGASPSGRHGPVGALPRIGASHLPSGGSTPQHSAPFVQGRLDRGGKAAPSSPGDPRGAHPLGPRMPIACFGGRAGA